jgi:hypothetical protein
MITLIKPAFNSFVVVYQSGDDTIFIDSIEEAGKTVNFDTIISAWMNN